MNLSSVNGKNWIFKKFNPSDVTNYADNFSLSEIVAKLISIRKKHMSIQGVIHHHYRFHFSF